MRRLLAALLAMTLAPLAAAQAPPAAPAEAASADKQLRVFEIRYQDMKDVSVILPTLLSDGHVLTVDAASHRVTVVDRPEFVQRVAEFLAQFDVPPQAVLVRLVLEKAELPEPVQGDGVDLASRPWKRSQLGETTFEVEERKEVTQSLGPDGAFEIRVRLGSVDVQRRLMRFDEVSVSRRTISPAGTPAAPAREIFRTPLEVQDKVGKTVMAAQDNSADVALVLKVLALIREPNPGP
jgi:hypothetical protein